MRGRGGLIRSAYSSPLFVVLLAALVLAAGASAAPPKAGLLVPGKSLGGLALGASRDQVRSRWGSGYGVCRGCNRPTWYFNNRRFDKRGVGVSFRRGRAASLFTLWAPPGWHTTRGLKIGDPATLITGLYGATLRVDCGTYSAETLTRGRTTTSFYVVDDEIWGFGLSVATEPVCR
jgi:hypothetical protein